MDNGKDQIFSDTELWFMKGVENLEEVGLLYSWSGTVMRLGFIWCDCKLNQ